MCYIARKPRNVPAKLQDRPAVAGVADMDYHDLPLRDDANVKARIREIEEDGITNGQRDETATAMGIKDAVSTPSVVIVSAQMSKAARSPHSILHVIGSMNFPASFPVDAIHLILENVMKRLLQFWGGKFKSQVPAGDENAKFIDACVLSKDSWDTMNRMVTLSSKLIPSSMRNSITSVSTRLRWTAETHLFFLITLGPIILKEHLPAPYFHHFLDLSELMKLTVGLNLEKATDLQCIRTGLLRWVNRFDE